MEKDKITVDELVKKAGSRYNLVALVAKRSQEVLFECDRSMKASEVINKVFHEVADGKIKLKEGGKDEGK